jgi:hypothetical protein
MENLPKILQVVADVNTLARKDAILSVMQRDVRFSALGCFS